MTKGFYCLWASQVNDYLFRFSRLVTILSTIFFEINWMETRLSGMMQRWGQAGGKGFLSSVNDYLAGCRAGFFFTCYVAGKKARDS
jgi:hypothetical protein